MVKPPSVIYNSVPLDLKLHRFFTQRRHRERLSSHQILRAAVVAYVLGDLKVTYSGYQVAAVPTEHPETVIRHDDGTTETYSLEDAELTREIIDRGLRDPVSQRYARKDRWLTSRDLCRMARERFGGRVDISHVQDVLYKRFPQHKRGGRYRIRPSSPDVDKIMEAVEDKIRGMTAEELRANAIKASKARAARRKERSETLEEAERHRAERVTKARRDAAKNT